MKNLKTCVCGSTAFRQQSPFYAISKLVTNEEPILVCKKCGRKNEYAIEKPSIAPERLNG